MTPFEKLQTEKVWTVSLPNGAPLDFDCAKQNDLRFLYLNTLFNDRVQGIVQPTLEQQAILQAFIIDAQKKKFDSKALLPLYREKNYNTFIQTTLNMPPVKTLLIVNSREHCLRH